jgi:TPR repeat protein
MDMKRIILNIGLYFSFLTVCGQNEIVVVDFNQSTKDISARTNRRDDVNGTPCALIKIQFPLRGTQFIGDIVGSTTLKTNEYWVYLPQKTSQLEVRHIDFKPLIINFPEHGIESVESNCTYELCLLAKEKNAPQLYNDGLIALGKNDVINAFEKLTKAADAGYSPALYAMGNESIAPFDPNYDEDPNTVDSYQEAFNYYKRAAEQGLPQAQYALVKMIMDYKDNKIPQISIDAKMLEDDFVWDYLEKAADKGCIDAQWYMVSKRDWCEKAAMKGIALAEYGMGVWFDDLESMNSAAYFHGWEEKIGYLKDCLNADENRTTNVAQATSWYEKAASKGLNIAMWTLADKCQEGVGTQKDINSAITLRKRVAEKGDIYCQLYLAHAFCFGVMAAYYDDGGWGDHSVEISEDMKEAGYWLRRVLNHPEDELIELMRYAGNNIHSDCDEFAFKFSEMGNKQESVYWLQRAAEWGSESAIEKLTELGLSIPQKLYDEE